MRKKQTNRGSVTAILSDCPMLLAIVISALLVTLLLTAFRSSDASGPPTPGDDGQLSSEFPDESFGPIQPFEPIPAATTAAPSETPETGEPAPSDLTPTEPGVTESGEISTGPDSTETEPPAPDSSEHEPAETLRPVPERPTRPPTEPPTEAPTEAPTEPEPTYPSGFTTVDERYFSDALFIGDSRTDGLRLYEPIGDAKYYCTTSMNIYKIMDCTEPAYGYSSLRDLLKGETFGKIYIMFGINEAGYNTDHFANKYREVVTEIRSLQPGAIIYIQSILYVTQNKENKDPVFSTANLKEKNAKLKLLANNVDVFYLEVNDAINDGTDHLPSEYTGDGVHMKAKYYHLWTDYLMEHAIVNAAHPWEP